MQVAVGDTRFSEKLADKTSVKEILNDKSVDPAKAGNSFGESASGNHMSDVFSKAFKELCGYVDDVVEEEIDEERDSCEEFYEFHLNSIFDLFDFSFTQKIVFENQK